MGRAAPVTTYLSPRGAEFAAESSCGGFECYLPLILEHLFMLVWIGLLSLVVVAALLYLPKAREICTEEWRRTKDELEALDRFISRVATIDIGTTDRAAAAVQGGGVAVPMTHVSEGGASMSTVRDSYRSTVMAVPHYTEEYDETLEEHMAAEFSEDVASAVCHNDTLTPPVRQAVIEHAKRAKDEREALLRALDHEADAIHEANHTLGSIQRTLEGLSADNIRTKSFDELQGAWHRLNDLNDRRQAVLQSRQQALHDGIRLGRRNEDSSHFYEYLYHPLDVTYPVLSDGVVLSEEIDAARQRVLDALTRRV